MTCLGKYNVPLKWFNHLNLINLLNVFKDVLTACLWKRSVFFHCQSTVWSLHTVRSHKASNNSAFALSLISSLHILEMLPEQWQDEFNALVIIYLRYFSISYRNNSFFKRLISQWSKGKLKSCSKLIRKRSIWSRTTAQKCTPSPRKGKWTVFFILVFNVVFIFFSFFLIYLYCKLLF